MKLEIILFGATGLFIYNTFYDNKLGKWFRNYKKYIQIAGILFTAYSLYIMIRFKPKDTRNMVLYANQALKQFPIDKSAMHMLSPVFDFTTSDFMNGLNQNMYGDAYKPNIYPSPVTPPYHSQQPHPAKKVKTTKRSVSETKKKYVAYMQDWKCAACASKLTHTFEVDHRLRLDNGGSNDVSNLMALCRECHGQKTASENM